MHSAEAADRLPIAKVPTDVKFPPDDENVYAGKAEFYRLNYGKYLIGMNLTMDNNFELILPPEFVHARELVCGKTLESDAAQQVPPHSIVVLWREP